MLLKYAIEVEKTGSITQAAGNLSMDQPNLSKAIKSLEESLGAPVFKRTPKGVVPTAKGKVYLEYARTILSQIEEMEALYKPSKSSRVEFSLSVPRASYISYAFSLFVRELKKTEGMNIWFRETNSMDTVRDVESGEYQMGVIRFQSSLEKNYLQLLAEKGLEAVKVWEYDCMALMSEKHPLAQREPLSASDFEQYVELVHGDISMPVPDREHKKKDVQKAQSGGRIYVYERGSQFDLLCIDPHAYMWVSPLPEETLKRHHLIQRRCRRPGCSYEDVLIYGRGYKKTKWDEAFLKRLDQIRDEVSGKKNC